jgi:asparagine synthase (glutamine-hydrolysing)
MCGIVGLAGHTDLGCITAMSSAIAHRGPDETGDYFDPASKVALAAHRLSILDLPTGHQPMANEDKTVWIVFNGEIYNSPELRSGLEGRHEFATTNSDTEVLIHLYEEQGESMLDHLNGMFAFIIHDKERNCLFAARDHVGIKPLYYWEQPGSLALASELKGLLQLPGFSRQVDHQSLYHYLSLRYVPGEDTIFSGVKRLPPGHWLHYDLAGGNLQVHRYWELELQPQQGLSADEWAERLRTELRAAVLRWTLSDVPIACSLSGGLDSTSMVGLLAEAGHPLRTYTLGFAGEDEVNFGEQALAREVAARWGADHHELTLAPDQLLDDLVPMVWSLDEPYGGGLPSWYVFRFMSQDVKVGLTGSGGDELFGNYRKWDYMESRGLRRLAYGAYRALRREGGAAISGQRYSASLRASLAGMSNAAVAEPMRFYEHLYYTDVEKRDLLVSEPTGLIPSEELLLAAGRVASRLAPRDQVLLFDFGNQLPEEFLFMTDRFSMAHSLEARVPFLDRELLELVRRIPSRVRTRRDDPKYLLRRAVGDLLPLAVRENRRKRGFVLPTGPWLRGRLRPLADRLLGREHLRSQGLFNPDYYGRFVQPHMDGRRELGERIWPMLMFQLWWEVYIAADSREMPSFTWKDLA